MNATKPRRGRPPGPKKQLFRKWVTSLTYNRLALIVLEERARLKRERRATQ